MMQPSSTTEAPDLSVKKKKKQENKVSFTLFYKTSLQTKFQNIWST